MLLKALIYYLANRSWESKRNYLIKKGAKIGEGTRLNCSSSSFGTEPYLITVGNDCLFASGVKFITHDGGIKVLNSLNKFDGIRMDKISPINIGNNTYIGAEAMVMPGVIIGNNCIIGAHSVVTKNIPDNSVAVGIPAKVIYDIQTYYNKCIEKEQLYPTPNMSYGEKKNYFSQKFNIMQQNKR